MTSWRWIYKIEVAKPLQLEVPTKKEKKKAPHTTNEELPKDWQFKKDHPKEFIIGEILKEVTTKTSLRFLVNIASISQIKPKSTSKVFNDKYWVLAMQEKHHQFKRNNVWNLILRPKIILLLALNGFIGINLTSKVFLLWIKLD